MLKQIIEEIKNENNGEATIIYINFEDLEYENIKTAKDLHKCYILNFPNESIFSALITLIDSPPGT